MEDKVHNLRNQYPVFTYDRFSVTHQDNILEILFFFTLGELSFTSKVAIPTADNKISVQDIEPFVFNLGLVEMISYWKATCSPRIFVKAGYLTDDQKKWWKNLLINGLGEFFFTNIIDFTAPDFVTIDSIAGSPFPVYAKKHSGKTLIPIGGGKDSIVTLEQYEKNGIPHQCLLLNPNPGAQAVIAKSQESDPILITRKLDPHLWKLNEEGYLNGHTPFSAYLAFLSLLCCALYDSSYVAVSNEKSSNEGNLQYKGVEINHQYSKSFEFEKNLATYIHQFVSPTLHYFSFMRPLGEIQIAQLFSQHKKYFDVFKSCNSGRGLQWCGVCPKCASVYTLLYPFIGHRDMIAIFGHDLFEKSELIGLFEQLLGITGSKPFECVGTYEETQVALYLAYKNIQQMNGKMPVVVSHFDFLFKGKEKEFDSKSKQILTAWNNENLVPPERVNALQKELQIS